MIAQQMPTAPGTNLARRFASAAGLLLGLLAATGGCQDRLSLTVVISAADALGKTELSNPLSLTLLDANTGQAAGPAALADASELQQRTRLFEAVDLVEGRNYQLTVESSVGDDIGCPLGRVVGVSPPFRYEQALEQVELHLDCADGSSVIDAPAEPRVFHSATWLPEPRPWGQVVIAGGADNVVDVENPSAEVTLYDSVLRYEPLDGRFRRVPEVKLSPPRVLHTATRIGDTELLFVGGFEARRIAQQRQFAPLRLVDRFSGTTLSGLPGLQLGRGGHAAALVAPDRLAVAKGYPEGNPLGPSLEIYDPVAGQSVAVITNTGGLPRITPAAIALPQQRQALFIGGLNLDIAPIPNELLCLDKGCKCEPPCVAKVPGFPRAQGLFWLTATLVRCSPTSDEGAIYLVGGQRDTEGSLSDQISCLETSSLDKAPELVGRLREPRSLHTTTLVRGPGGTQRLFVAGGNTADGSNSAAELSAELVTVGCSCPQRITSADISSVPLKQLHSLHTATLLPDGSVLLYGGLVPGAAERFIPDV